MAQPTARKGDVDLSEIEAFGLRRGPSCSVPLRIGELSAEKRRTFEAALAKETLTAKAISKWLASLGVELSHWTLQRHRRGDCSCDRS